MMESVFVVVMLVHCAIKFNLSEFTENDLNTHISELHQKVGP